MREYDKAKHKDRLSELKSLGFTEVEPKFSGDEFYMLEVVDQKRGIRLTYSFMEGETEAEMIDRIIADQKHPERSAKAVLPEK